MCCRRRHLHAACPPARPQGRAADAHPGVPWGAGPLQPGGHSRTGPQRAAGTARPVAHGASGCARAGWHAANPHRRPCVPLWLGPVYGGGAPLRCGGSRDGVLTCSLPATRRRPPVVKAVHDVYCRMMGEPATASAPASDQSAHSAVQLQAGGGAAGLSSGPAGATAAAAAVRGAFNLYGRIGSFDPPYAQQHAQPPAGAAQQAHQQWAGGLPAHEPAAAARRARAVRCICGSGAERGGMVRCTGRGCGVWQHADCLGLELRDPEAARGFRCERCRCLWGRELGAWLPCAGPAPPPCPAGCPPHAGRAGAAWSLCCEQARVRDARPTGTGCQAVAGLDVIPPRGDHDPRTATLVACLFLAPVAPALQGTAGGPILGGNRGCAAAQCAEVAGGRKAWLLGCWHGTARRNSGSPRCQLMVCQTTACRFLMPRRCAPRDPYAPPPAYCVLCSRGGRRC